MRDFRLTFAALGWAFVAFWLVLTPVAPPPARLIGLAMTWPLLRAVFSLLASAAAEALGRPLVVYYLRDERGHLLYVGQTIQPFPARLAKHMNDEDDEARPWRGSISPAHSGPVRRCLTETGLDTSEAYRIRALALAGRMRLAQPIRNKVFNRASSRKARSPLQVVHLLVESAVHPPARWHGGEGGASPEMPAPAPVTADAVSLAWAEAGPVQVPAPAEPASDAASFESMMAEEFPDGLGVVADGPNDPGWDHQGRPHTPVGGGDVPGVAPGTEGPDVTASEQGQSTPPPSSGSPVDAADGSGLRPSPASGEPTPPPADAGRRSGSDGAVVRGPGGAKLCVCGCGGVATRGPRTEACHKAWERDRRKRYPRKGK